MVQGLDLASKTHAQPTALPILVPRILTDVLVMNIGAHCSRSMAFEPWQRYIETVAAYVKAELIAKGVPVIWRTSFLMKEHVFRSYTHADGYVPPAHFNTEARRQIFDSYAEHVLAPVGVHIWDVYGEWWRVVAGQEEAKERGEGGCLRSVTATEARWVVSSCMRIGATMAQQLHESA